MLRDGNLYTTAEIKLIFDRSLDKANKYISKSVEEANAKFGVDDKDPMTTFLFSMTAMIGMTELKKQLFGEEK